MNGEMLRKTIETSQARQADWDKKTDEARRLPEGKLVDRRINLSMECGRIFRQLLEGDQIEEVVELQAAESDIWTRTIMVEVEGLRTPVEIKEAPMSEPESYVGAKEYTAVMAELPHTRLVKVKTGVLFNYTPEELGRMEAAHDTALELLKGATSGSQYQPHAAETTPA